MIKIAETFFVRATLFLTVFLNIWGGLNHFIPTLKTSFAIFISLFISPILAPSLKYIYTKGKRKIQVKWMFCKKPLLLNY